MARSKEKSRDEFAKGKYVRQAIQSYEDVGSSEDEFQAGRDSIAVDGHAAEKDVEFSDEEVFSIEGSQTEDEEDDVEVEVEKYEESSRSEVEEEDEEGEDMKWSRREYYGGNSIENEEDYELQKAEIEKMERERLEGFADADFEVDEWKNLPQQPDSAPPLTRKSPSQMSMEEKCDLMDAIFPEFEALQAEFVANYTLLGPLQSLYEKDPAHRLVAAQYSALATYLGVLATYFAMRASKQYESESLRDHDIMTSILTTRQLWEAIRSIKSHPERVVETSPTTTLPTPPSKKKKRKVADVDMDGEIHIETGYFPSQSTKRKDRLNVDALLAEVDAQDKRARRKSLRFHASQIDQTRHRRDQAAKLAGDTDLPYRERQKERAAREHRAAVQRGGARGEDLDGEEADDAELRRGEAMRNESLAYYDSVAQAGKQAKREKKRDHDGTRDALKEHGYSMEEIATHGKRALNRQIEKNKGLMPSRGKDQRNPRVKKRKKFAKAQKKLATRKPLVKADRGAYHGELSGISSRTIKSVAFT